MEAGKKLLINKKFDEAYKSFLNASFYSFQEHGEFLKEAAIGAHSAAKGMKQPIIAELIRPLISEDSEEEV